MKTGKGRKRIFFIEGKGAQKNIWLMRPHEGGRIKKGHKILFQIFVAPAWQVQQKQQKGIEKGRKKTFS